MINYQYNDKLLKRYFVHSSSLQEKMNQKPYHFNDKILHDETRNRVIKTALWLPHTHHPNERPLIIFSHGSKGNRFNHSYLAEYLSAHGYIIAAIEHPEDNTSNHSRSTSIDNLWHRPLDVKFVINTLLKESTALLIDKTKIVFVGYSFGGYTGLALAGAAPHFTRLKNFSRVNCYFDLTHHHLFEPRIKAYTLLAPALSVLFEKKDLHAISAPILLCLSGQDEYLKHDNKFYSSHLLSAKIRINFKEAGHYVYLTSLPKHIQRKKHTSFYDIGTSREWVHPILKKHILNYLNENLHDLDH